MVELLLLLHVRLVCHVQVMCVLLVRMLRWLVCSARSGPIARAGQQHTLRSAQRSYGAGQSKRGEASQHGVERATLRTLLLLCSCN